MDPSLLEHRMSAARHGRLVERSAAAAAVFGTDGDLASGGDARGVAEGGHRRLRRVHQGDGRCDGGRTDVGTISHDAAIGQAQFSGAPDGEDHQVLTMAVQSGATVLATSDGGLLEMGTYTGVEIWASTEIDAEVWANVRRIHAAREARR